MKMVFFLSPPLLSGTPFLTAIEKNHLDIAKILFANGASADISIPDNLGRRPLHMACRVDTLRWLYKNGAAGDLNIESGFDNDSGTTSDNDCETTSELSTIVASEGRLLTLEFEHMFVVNAYVPNSGQGLKRLAYRTQEWDIQLGEHLRRLKKPVILIGDLNVAHNVIDIHNFYQRPGFPTELGDNEYKGLSQLKKQAGCTPIERELVIIKNWKRLRTPKMFQRRTTSTLPL